MSKWKSNIIKFFSKERNIKVGSKFMVVFIITSLLFILAIRVAYSQMTVAKQDMNIVEDKSDRANEMAQLALLIQTKDAKFGDYVITQEEMYLLEIEELNNEINE